MNALAYSDLRSNLADVMEKVCDDHDPVIITRSKKRPVVLMSLEDYESIEETLHLLGSPKNASRLMESIANIRAGNYQERELLPDEG